MIGMTVDQHMAARYCMECCGSLSTTDAEYVAATELTRDYPG